MRYLRSIQERHGWSVARVARESRGQISRATIFRMMSGDTRRVPIDAVRLVASIVGDDPEDVLKEVAGSVIDVEREDRLRDLDPDDPVVRHIMGLDVDEEMRGFMLDRRREILALRREQDIREVEIWGNRILRLRYGPGIEILENPELQERIEKESEPLIAALERMSPEELAEMVERVKRESRDRAA